MKFLCFAASNSSQSINKKLVKYAGDILQDILDNPEIEIIDINDYEMPIFSEDRQNKDGIPELAKNFYKKISACDALIISFAENNGSYTVAYKNIFDWTSRIEDIKRNIFQNKPTVYLSTSPGPMGGSRVMETAVSVASRYGVELKGHLSVPSFYKNFNLEQGVISNEEINTTLIALLKTSFYV